MQIKLVIVLVLLSLVNACGGSSSSQSEPDIPTVSFQVGRFEDTAVEGLQFQTASQQGFTNSQGEFQYLAGETVTFSIGTLVFPSVTAQAIITPLNIFSTNDVNHQGVINMLRLLQTIDADGNLSNGIMISQMLRDVASSINLDLDFEQVDFTTQVAELLSMSDINDTELVSTGEALLHFQESLDMLNISYIGACGSDHNMVGYSGSFDTFAHNVSGQAMILDNCTIEISQFNYDGGGPQVYFYAGIDHQYSDSSAFAIGEQIDGQVYNNETLIISLPPDKSLDDLNGISVWCIDFAANFGQLTFAP
ncbi:MAG: DM13 domain-containing protein [Gammaproteobacteria bacterium]|nr:DM13 domain-containing protein [Gammaproteobacteria bacterium]